MYLSRQYIWSYHRHLFTIQLILLFRKVPSMDGSVTPTPSKKILKNHKSNAFWIFVKFEYKTKFSIFSKLLIKYDVYLARARKILKIGFVSKLKKKSQIALDLCFFYYFLLGVRVRILIFFKILIFLQTFFLPFVQAFVSFRAQSAFCAKLVFLTLLYGL